MDKVDKWRAPLFEAMLEHVKRKRASFHVPGHKGRPPAEAGAAEIFRRLLPFDLTELSGLDDLHQPEEAIREAQQLAADCFGAEETYFLVGGSTAGNLALILAVCRPGDLIIVQRNAHKSVFHGLMLAGARAVFLTPQWEESARLAGGVRAEDVERALEKYPQAKAVFLTNPNYYGIGADLRPIAEIVHARNIPLLVDEAHGAHYGFHPELPPSALQCGADAVVQSTHKMLTAMTMGSMLHVQGRLVDRAAVKSRLAMLQTSSPSYPILASLDLCRLDMHRNGRERLERALGAVRHARSGIERLERFRLLGGASGRWLEDERLCNGNAGIDGNGRSGGARNGRPGSDPLDGERIGENWQERLAAATLDPFKLVISDRWGSLTGFELQAELERYGCYAEMADPDHAVLAFSVHSTLDDANHLIFALSDISKRFFEKKQENAALSANNISISHFPQVSHPTVLPLPAVAASGSESDIRLVELDRAVGCRCAEMVIPYPPGIPVLVPGERIEAETVRQLKRLASHGAKFQGASDRTLHAIAVFTKKNPDGGTPQD